MQVKLTVRDRMFYVASLIAILVLITIVIFKYQKLPSSIPIFVDLWGNPALQKSKTLFLCLRLPLMGLVAYMVCFLSNYYNHRTLHKDRKLFLDEKRKLQRSISGLWMSLTITLSIKTVLISLMMFVYPLMHIMQIVVAMVTIVGITCTVISLICLYQVKSINYNDINLFAKNEIGVISVLGLLYVLLVFSPLV